MANIEQYQHFNHPTEANDVIYYVEGDKGGNGYLTVGRTGKNEWTLYDIQTSPERSGIGLVLMDDFCRSVISGSLVKIPVVHEPSLIFLANRDNRLHGVRQKGLELPISVELLHQIPIVEFLDKTQIVVHEGRIRFEMIKGDRYPFRAHLKGTVK